MITEENLCLCTWISLVPRLHLIWPATQIHPNMSVCKLWYMFIPKRHARVFHEYALVPGSGRFWQVSKWRKQWWTVDKPSMSLECYEPGNKEAQKTAVWLVFGEPHILYKLRVDCLDSMRSPRNQCGEQWPEVWHGRAEDDVWHHTETHLSRYSSLQRYGDMANWSWSRPFWGARETDSHICGGRV